MAMGAALMLLAGGKTRHADRVYKKHGRIPINLVGRVFGRLRVVAFANAGDDGRLRWRCYCDPKLDGCGATIVARGSHLRGGIVRSCGCLRREMASQRARTRNDRRGMVVALRALETLRCT